MDLTQDYTYQSRVVADDELPFEFFMNRFRLTEPCPKSDYTDYTGLVLDKNTQSNLHNAVQKGLIAETEQHWQVTPLGRRYLNTLLEMMV